MNRFIKPDVIHTLGNTQAHDYQPNGHAEKQAQPDCEPSLWEKFKAKAKRAWTNVMTVAKDIRENIVPISTGVGTFLTGLATFCNRTRKYAQQRSYYRCAA